MAFVVFWGTFWPLIAEALTGTRRALGPPWFDKYTVPLAIMLVLLSGIGPVIAWRKATAANARRNFLLPAVAALGLGVVLAAFGAAVAAARPGDVRLRRVRRRERRPGVLARRRRAARDDGRGAAARAALARRAQPPPLRRLPRARRHGAAVHRRRGVVGVQQRARRAPDARPDDARRRLRLHVRQGDLARVDDEGRRAREDLLRRGRRRHPRRREGRDAAPGARLLPVARPRRPRPGGPLLRGRGDERGRPEGRACAATCGPR